MHGDAHACRNVEFIVTTCINAISPVICPGIVGYPCGRVPWIVEAYPAIHRIATTIGIIYTQLRLVVVIAFDDKPVIRTSVPTGCMHVRRGRRPAPRLRSDVVCEGSAPEIVVITTQRAVILPVFNSNICRSSGVIAICNNHLGVPAIVIIPYRGSVHPRTESYLNISIVIPITVTCTTVPSNKLKSHRMSHCSAPPGAPVSQTRLLRRINR